MRRSIQSNFFVSTSLLALVITLHLQMLRVFFPSVAWYLKDTIEVESTTLALYVLIVMNIGFSSALFNNIFGKKLILLITTGGIALARILEQFVHLPSADLWISMIGCGLFAIFLPTFISHIRAKGAQLAGPIWAYGLFLGLALDSSIHGFTSTLDLSWIPGALPLIVILILGFIIVGLLLSEDYPPQDTLTDTGWRENLAFPALGPFLVLQVLVYQNQGWVSELSGVPGEWGYVLVMLGNVLAVGGIFGGFKYQHLFQPTPTMAVGIIIATLSLTIAQPGLIFVLAFLLIQLLFGWSWAHMGNLTARARRKGYGHTTVMTTAGLLLFILLTFIYYAALDLPLPFYREAILPISAVFFGLTFLGLGLQAPKAMKRTRQINEPFVFTGILLLLSMLHSIFNPPSPIPESPSGTAVRIMTYNIHSAYDIEGRQDPEAIAKVIEESGTDIVAIQEISRGWVVNGSTDLTTWLSHRLGMQVVFKGTTGPMWGNAILSRFPILQVRHGKLPALGTSLERGYLMAEIDFGYDQPVNVFVTHLHHVASDPIIRFGQLTELIHVWGKRPYSIILGDLNARPVDSEIKLLLNAGLVDSWSEAGVGEGNTFSSDNPFKRIDWIWHTSDLIAQEAEVPRSTASDHLPVIIAIKPQGK